MDLGKLGIWGILDPLTSQQTASLARKLEAWGYSALWQAEGFGRNVLAHSSWLLANTSTLVVASGIANVYGHDPVAMVGGQYGLSEQSNGRFLLGIGVSHGPVVTGRGHAYGPPVATMRAYLEAMARHKYGAPGPAERPPTIIAALGPKMLELAAELADGAHPYNVTPDHTATARRILGPGKLLCVEQKVMLESDAAKARAAGRRVVGMSLTLPNYQASLSKLGFGDSDFANGGSDRLIDALIAWGDEEAIRDRIQQHWDAGADHVCIQPIHPDGSHPLDENALAVLAPSGSSV